MVDLRHDFGLPEGCYWSCPSTDFRGLEKQVNQIDEVLGNAENKLGSTEVGQLYDERVSAFRVIAHGLERARGKCEDQSPWRPNVKGHQAIPSTVCGAVDELIVLDRNTFSVTKEGSK